MSKMGCELTREDLVRYSEAVDFDSDLGFGLLVRQEEGSERRVGVCKMRGWDCGRCTNTVELR